MNVTTIIIYLGNKVLNLLIQIEIDRAIVRCAIVMLNILIKVKTPIANQFVKLGNFITKKVIVVMMIVLQKHLNLIALSAEIATKAVKVVLGAKIINV